MQSYQCPSCKYYIGDRHCKAFPDWDGIPVEIFTGEHDHRDPWPGDNGIRWEPAPGFEGFEAELVANGTKDGQPAFGPPPATSTRDHVENSYAVWMLLPRWFDAGTAVLIGDNPYEESFDPKVIY